MTSIVNIITIITITYWYGVITEECSKDKVSTTWDKKDAMESIELRTHVFALEEMYIISWIEFIVSEHNELALTNETAVLALLWAKYFQNRRAKYLRKQRTSENLIEILKEGS